MSDRRFRFGTVVSYAAGGDDWARQARRAEELGYATLLMPDTMATLSVPAALAAAGAVTSTLRLGSFVLNTSLRPPAAVAQDALSIDTLSDGRLELGLGAGRPGAEHEAAALGVEPGTPGQRVRRLLETIRASKEAFARPGGAVRGVQRPHPPILVAASGPRLLASAVAEADIVGFGMRPESDEEALVLKAAALRTEVGSALDRVELSFNLAAMATEVDGLPPGMERMTGRSGPELVAMRAASVLVGEPKEVADVLRRRRERTGISYVSVGAHSMEQFAPVVELLAGT